MKRINKYFYTGCISFTLINLITLIIHFIQRIPTINVKSEVNTIIIILIIEVVCCFIESLSIKSGTLHLALELAISCVITFGIGIPSGLIEEIDLSNLGNILSIIAVTYVITTLSLYIGVKKDEEEINDIINKINN